LPIVADADILYTPFIKKLLEREHIVITPHPKEFVALLRLLEIADLNIDELQKNRFEYAELFSRAYPHVVLLLKGANVIIAHNDTYYINPHGSVKLAKGGSGDVLSGLIAGLLAQGYSPLEATIHGSLTHTTLAERFDGANFSLTPTALVEQISKL